MVERDSGAQPERTALAWQRTVLSVTIGSLVLAATGVRMDTHWIAVVAVGIAAAAFLPFVFRAPQGGVPSHGRLHGWWFLVRMVVLVATLGFVGAAAVVASILRG
ncbi:uncharacterized protein DUF202 [Sediminihabitans luteus]|uniref:Uncharacterized protein DUF202 n=1 Tax=Sediminihabitans luteus TaxID=1138585 RepID=A0A2M9CYF8_9CELL|nr:DUF202 domain-containing protein [Sediminihabitans luteus]PJJ76972.1 uncharacterized protein DUF202 [Sediminihabitans luteus]GII99613.1 hypothetical protein Slu03_19910 [Sediminihabitans luteus]